MWQPCANKLPWGCYAFPLPSSTRQDTAPSAVDVFYVAIARLLVFRPLGGLVLQHLVPQTSERCFKHFNRHIPTFF
eukprot:4530608-Amphidinium_carterae.1